MFSALRNRTQWRDMSRGFLVMVSGKQMTYSTESKPERVSKQLSYRPAFASPIDSDIRPLVVIYGWLVAKSKHIHKYGDYYLGQGFDVLHVKITPGQMLWPVLGQKVIGDVMDFVSDGAHAQKPLLLHGFSVGGHLIGETYVAMKNDPEKYEQVGDRIRGHIFDSPVDYYGVPHSFGKAMTNVPILQKMITISLNGYLGIFKNAVQQYYIRSSDCIHENKWKVPSLMLSSSSDPVCPMHTIDDIMEEWRRQGITKVYSKYWDNSPHVSHFLYHPVEYMQQLNNFIEVIGLKYVHFDRSKVPQTQAVRV